MSLSPEEARKAELMRVDVEEAIAPAREAWLAAERLRALRSVPAKLRAWWLTTSALEKEVIASIALVLVITVINVGGEVVQARLTRPKDDEVDQDEELVDEEAEA